MKKILAVLLLVFMISLLVGCSFGNILGKASEPEPSDDGPTNTPNPAPENLEVAIYFSDWQAQYVIPEFRIIDSDENLAQSIVKELLKGPEQPHLYRTFPEGTEINSVEVIDGTAYVNFKGDIHVPGSASEIAAINSLVLSLTDLPGINNVQILIDGVSDVSLGGHILLNEPIERPGICTYPVFVDEDRASWLQEQVNKGMEEWRTDPVQVASKEGKMFGFTQETEFTLEEVIDDANPTAIVKARHNGQDYIIELMQIEEKGDNGVWTITDINE